ncbi:MAG: hypothetical protein GEU99_13095 [Luteitalea sp.]|nr:hypothetical protein [Luteitalea sp.]
MSRNNDAPCHDISIELSALVAGELDEHARAEIERHLSFCPGCQFEWRTNELVWRCLTACKDVDPPAELRNRVFDAIAEYDRTHAK